jgi:nicotinamide mononucleotide adenylyltransferase
VVGITNPDPFLTKEEATDTGRSDCLANPLTYYERFVMLRTVLLDAGLDWQSFSIVPFPINLPERYVYYVPMDAAFFLSIYDDWGRRKLNYFKSLGLDVHILWEVPPEQKGISAGDIRQCMITGEPWQHLVPGCVPPLIHHWGVTDRLRRMKMKSEGNASP